jgi:hypothetical protein
MKLLLKFKSLARPCWPLINKVLNILILLYSCVYKCLIFLHLYLSKNVKNANAIVLISETGHIRVLKIAMALNHLGIKPVLLTRNKNYVGNVHFTKVFIYRNNYQLLYFAIKKYSGSVFHFFCMWNYDLPTHFIKFKVGKVVIDSFDILNYFTTPKISSLYAKQIELERFCILNCAGLVCRDLRTNLLKKNGWKIPSRILFMEYMDVEPNSHIKKILSSNLIYLGNLDSDPMSTVAFQYELAELLNKKKIFFTMYPSYDYLTERVSMVLEKINPHILAEGYITMSNKLNFETLRNEILDKSFGLLISSKQVTIDESHDTYLPILNRYFFAAKLFDYYEAGVFPLVQQSRFIAHVLRSMEIGSTVHSLSDIPTIINKLSGTTLNVVHNERFTLKFNAMRLLSFYGRL